MTHGVPLRKLQDMQQRSITKPCLRGQISTRSLILWLIIDLHWRQTSDPRPLPRKQGINIHSASCRRTAGCVLSEGTTVRTGFQKPGSYTERRSKGPGASPHLSVGDLGAPGPRLPAGCRPSGHLAAPVLLEALQEQVINRSKMVVAAVLQRLEDIGRAF